MRDVLAVQLDKAVIDEAAGTALNRVDFPAPLEPMIVAKIAVVQMQDSSERLVWR